MTKTIEILIAPDGKTSLQTLGFSGSACRGASKFLEEALGKRLTEQRTTEFYQSQAAEQIQQQHGS
jgi:hypothetical protein